MVVEELPSTRIRKGREGEREEFAPLLPLLHDISSTSSCQLACEL